MSDAASYDGTGKPHGDLLAGDGTRRLFRGQHGIEVRAISSTRHEETKWSQRWIEIELPDGRSFGQAELLAARTLEWGLDVIIRYGDTLELVRISPWRVRARRVLCAQDGKRIHDVERVLTTPTGFSIAERNGRRHQVDCDLVRFEQRTTTTFASKFPFEVFISYKAADSQELAARFDQRLKSAGLSTWMAPDDVFGDFRESIAKGIESSQYFLIIWSANSALEEPDRLPGGSLKMSQAVEVRDIWRELRGNTDGRQAYFYLTDQWVEGPAEFVEKDRSHFHRSPSWSVDRFVGALVDDIGAKRRAIGG